MKTVLVISSFVAASRVGATASAFCLRRLGIEAVILPTTLLGRHPGWGAPGGGSTDVETLNVMWDAIRAQNIHFDGVLSGYMGHEDHVLLCERIIKNVKTANPSCHILVDPVMGDNGSLYIPKDRADAISTYLVPLADTLTPNLWELSYLAKKELTDVDTLLKEARTLTPQALITSVPDGGNIGAVLVTPDKMSQVSHKRYESVPHGGGDSLAATFLAHTLSGLSSQDAMERSVASIFNIMSAANKFDLGELPLVREQQALINAKPLKSRKIEL